MDFIEHNLNIKPIISGSVTIYRLDQKSGSEQHPLLDTLFINDGNIEELIELWLTNPGCEQHRDWLLAKLKDSGAVEGQQQQ